MIPKNSTFRNGLYAGLLIAVCGGIYLSQLWDATNQVRLHTTNLMTALEDNNWSRVQHFLHPSYADQWGHDRARLISRLREILPHLKNLHFQAREEIIQAEKGEGEWRARVTLEAEPSEASALITQRVNKLEEPFVLEWRQGSRKPWDWKLVRVSNPGLEIPDSAF